MRLLDWILSNSPARRKPTRLSELIYPIIIITQGIVWLRPDTSFALSVNYDIMRRVGPEEWWGYAWIASAILALALTSIGSIRLRRASLTISAALPLFVGLSFYASNPLATTAIPFLGVGIAAIVTLIEVR